jgi:riboflavin synthase alpha subunit
MFSGIVERQGLVLRPGRKLLIDVGWTDLAYGESVSVSGVCLTVARLDGARAGFDLVPETLRRSTLGGLRRGGRVNLERSLRYGDRVSGHFVSGHVEGTGLVARAGAVLRIETPLAGRLLPKGSVAVDGVSLTVVDVEPGAFTVALIPTTRRITTLGRLRKGDRVNLEPDAAAWKPAPGSRITRGFLLRAGFP